MIMGKKSTERLMTLPELAEMLGVPIETLYGWRHRGDGPVGYRIGRCALPEVRVEREREPLHAGQVRCVQDLDWYFGHGPVLSPRCEQHLLAGI